LGKKPRGGGGLTQEDHNGENRVPVHSSQKGESQNTAGNKSGHAEKGRGEEGRGSTQGTLFMGKSDSNDLVQDRTKERRTKVGIKREGEK